VKRALAAAVSLAILGAILLAVDRAALWASLRATRPGPFALALFLFIPQNLIMAHRWRMLATPFAPIGWGRAIGMILGAQSLNVVLPSKLGDLSKAYFLKRTGDLDLSRATNLVVFEKMLDLASLSLLALLGAIGGLAMRVTTPDPRVFTSAAIATALLSALVIALVAALYFIPADRAPFLRRALDALGSRPRLARLHAVAATSHDVVGALQRRGARRGFICLLSIGLWGLHLVQIALFFICQSAEVPPLVFVALMPPAIFAGLLPISLFGVGVRDGAIIFLFGAHHPAETLAAVGLLVSLRYVIPALAGLPFLHYYLSLVRMDESGKDES
jgi:hypothetical protein